MSRITLPANKDAVPASTPLLDTVQEQLGSVPNIFLLLGLSPAALGGFLGLRTGLSKSFDAAMRERIAIAIAEVNGCDYCLSAHTYLAANMARLSEAEIERNRNGRSSDHKADAALKFAVSVAREKGKIGDRAVAEARSAGLSDAELVELVANVAINIFTNYLNNVAETPIDFPVVTAEPA